MDIQEFITETLKQITESVQENKSTLNSNSLQSHEKLKIKDFPLTKGGFVTSVDFDMAVTESSSQDGGAKLTIAGIGSLGGDKAASSQTVSRIKFTVPLHIKPET